jgi:hypothetical protein
MTESIVIEYCYYYRRYGVLAGVTDASYTHIRFLEAIKVAAEDLLGLSRSLGLPRLLSPSIEALLSMMSAWIFKC